MRRWTRDEVEQVAEMRDQGLSLTQIANRMNATKGQIHGVCRNYGMTRPLRTRAQTRRLVAKHLSEGGKVASAAADVGITFRYAAMLAREARLQ